WTSRWRPPDIARSTDSAIACWPGRGAPPIAVTAASIKVDRGISPAAGDAGWSVAAVIRSAYPRPVSRCLRRHPTGLSAAAHLSQHFCSGDTPELCGESLVHAGMESGAFHQMLLGEDLAGGVDPGDEVTTGVRHHQVDLHR